MGRMMMANNYVILGASGGIGAETCRRLRERGDNVFLGGRHEGRLQLLADELDAPLHVLDATEIQQVAECCEHANKTLGTLHGIVNCVGSVLLKPAHLTTAEEWQQTIATNLTSAFATVRAGYKVMKEQGGSIVLMSTAAARTGLPNHEAICRRLVCRSGYPRECRGSRFGQDRDDRAYLGEREVGKRLAWHARPRPTGWAWRCGVAADLVVGTRQ